MKKLLIAVAVITAAIATQAATANWAVTCSNIYNGKAGDSLAKVTGTGYIFDAGIKAQSALFTAFAEGLSLGTFDITKVDGYITSKSIDSGSFVVTDGANRFGYGEQTTDAGNPNIYNYYFVVVDGDKIFMSKVMENIGANANANYKTIGFGTAAPTSGNSSKTVPLTTGYQGAGLWSQAAAVPEPTSGLLLLLGMAGLALKRRRA